MSKLLTKRDENELWLERDAVEVDVVAGTMSPFGSWTANLRRTNRCRSQRGSTQRRILKSEVHGIPTNIRNEGVDNHESGV
jgi:hypothetical protein